jgi:peptide/nickel transport system substrate-binding protein
VGPPAWWIVGLREDIASRRIVATGPLVKGPTMLRRNAVVGLAATLALSLAAAGCGGGSSSGGGGSGAASKTLTLGVIVPATTFKAADMNFANESPYGQAVYDTLLKADPKGKVLPSLATEWSYNADRTVLTMKLRDDVTFTDDTKFNADAAAQNLVRFRDGASPNKNFLVNLKDAKAVDETTLELTLTQPDPGLLNYLTQNAGMMGSPKAFGAADEKTKPVGSGPYVMDTGATVVGSSYTFTKNAKYWNKDDQHYEKVVIKVFNDPTAMLNAVKGKQLSGAKLVNNDFVDQIKAGGYNLVNWELDWVGLILLDRDGKMNPALKDVKVRQALNHAFDKKGLLQAYGKGYGTPTSQIFPTNSPAYDPELDNRYPYDAAKAKSLLAEAGHPNGFELSMPSTTRISTTIWSLITQQLKDVGITAKFTDAGTNFIPHMLEPRYAATWMTLQQDPTDSQIINFEISPNATFNPFKSTDPKVADLINKFVNAKSDEESGAAAKELNAYIVEQAWFAPWFRLTSHFATDAKTEVVPQAGNAYPYLWNFKPKG